MRGAGRIASRTRAFAARGRAKSPAAVRQAAHRARNHVDARRSRIKVDRAEQEQIVERFLHAVGTGDLQALLHVLAPGVVLVADGGGAAQAARRPIEGARKVAWLLARFPTFAPDAVIRPVWLDGAPGALIGRHGNVIDTAVGVIVDAGQVAQIYAVRNPSKLSARTVLTTLPR